MRTLKSDGLKATNNKPDSAEEKQSSIEDLKADIQRRVEGFNSYQTFSLADLAREAGEQPEDLHYLYQKYRLFGPPTVKEGARKRYDLSDLKKVLLVVELKHQGLSPKQIKALLTTGQRVVASFQPSTVVPPIHAGMDFVLRVQVQAMARLLQIVGQKLSGGEVLRDALIAIDQVPRDPLYREAEPVQVRHPDKEYVEGLIQRYTQIPLGWSTAEGEVFTRYEGPESLIDRLPGWDLYLVTIDDPADECMFQIVLGVGQDSSDPEVLAIKQELEQIPSTLKDAVKEFLCRLMGIMFRVVLRLDSIIKVLPNKSTHRLMSQGDALSVLANAIVAIAPDKWEYCGIILPFGADSSMLHVAAASDGFPQALRERALYPIAQSLPGWVYKVGDPLVINEVIEHDLRIPFFDLERPSAVAVVPALAAEDEWTRTTSIDQLPDANQIGEHTKGVVYVGTRHLQDGKKLAFTEMDLKILGTLGQIAGEFIGRQQLNQQVVAGALRISSKSSIDHEDSADFRRALRDDLMKLIGDEIATQSTKDGLLILALRIVNYADLEEEGTAVASWTAEQVREKLGRFLESKQSSFANCRGTVFDLDHDQFVALISPIGPNVKDLREELRKRLEDLGELGMSMRVKALVWSLFFAFADLDRQYNFRESGEQGAISAAEMLYQRTSGALKVLAFIQEGDRLLRNREFDKAKGQYELAHYHDPENPYHLRHLAECLIGLKDYQEAINVAETAVGMEPNYPGSYRRLAEAYVSKGQFDEGFKNYEKAIKLEPGDPLTHLRYGQALRLRGDLGSIAKAIDQFREAMTLDKQDDRNRARYYRYIAQTWARVKNNKAAVDSYQQALAFEPDNNDLVADLELAIVDLIGPHTQPAE